MKVKAKKPKPKTKTIRMIDKKVFISGQALEQAKPTEIKDFTSIKCLKTIEAHEDCVETVVILGSGKVVTAWEDYTLKTWDLFDEGNKKLLMIFEGHEGYVTGIIEFGKDKIIAVSKDKIVRKWAVSTGKELFCYKLDQPLSFKKKMTII